MRDHRGRDSRSRAREIGDRVAVFVEQPAEIVLECCDADVELIDLACELADAMGGGFVGQPVAERDPLQAPQCLLAMDVSDLGFGFGIELRPDRAQALDGLGAISDRLAAKRLQQSDRADQLGLQRGPELVAFAQATWAIARASPGSLLPGPEVWRSRCVRQAGTLSTSCPAADKAAHSGRP